MNRGVPPTDLNARTGELTPPGITPHASANSRADMAVRASPFPRGICSALHMTNSVPARDQMSTTGCSGSAGLRQREHRVVGLVGQFPEVNLDGPPALLAVRGKNALAVLLRDLSGDIACAARL